MTVSIKDIRLKISEEQIDALVARRGIDSVFKPFDKENNIYDARFFTSNKSSVPAERLTIDDINKELDRLKLKIVTESPKDSPLYVKTFNKRRMSMVFETQEDNHAIDTIDDVRKGARNMSVEHDVPKGQNQIRWQDRSW